MKRNYHVLLVLMLALTTITGCRSLTALTHLKDCKYRIREVKPRVAIAFPFSASTVDLDFRIDVDNPNTVALNLDRLDFDLFVDQAKVMSGVSNQQIRIPAQGRGDVHLLASIDAQSVRLLAREIIESMNGDRAKYELRGRAHYDTPLGRVTFPFTVLRR